ncbi:CopD family protein [Sphingomonas sp. JC676]|uniref:CopD family protein n=1 Tax=Sphingomonas sp. JC676 TaxID=2768065 RepID=UPI0016583705|nr:CopD family protein [Sphingomonas sp. JC676]MBC9034595.1 CopD family protein [Sphingomonas sp. JC676]
MSGFLGGAYLWVKAFHIIFVIFWMAGLFMLPRYLVHHQEALGTPQAADWEKREALLRRMILSPSIVLVWILGLSLAVNIGLFDSGAGLGWLHAKLFLVVLLSGFHGWAIGYSKKLAKGQGSLSPRTLRMVGELPALAVILIVIVVVVKPF